MTELYGIYDHMNGYMMEEVWDNEAAAKDYIQREFLDGIWEANYVQHLYITKIIPIAVAAEPPKEIIWKSVK